jgi:hypothetical protein
MNKIEKLERLTEWADEIQKADAVIDPISEVLGLSVECPIHQAVWALQAAYTKSVSELVGDQEAWLDWYANENKFGEKGYEAGLKGNTRQIKSLEDLLWVIEETT